MGPSMRRGLFGGAIIALVVSVFHSQMFRSDLFAWYGLVAWYLVSALWGGVAGFLAVGLIPVPFHSSLAYLSGALFGAAGYLVQFYLFLLYMFRQASWE